MRRGPRKSLHRATPPVRTTPMVETNPAWADLLTGDSYDAHGARLPFNPHCYICRAREKGYPLQHSAEECALIAAGKEREIWRIRTPSRHAPHADRPSAPTKPIAQQAPSTAPRNAEHSECPDDA